MPSVRRTELGIGRELEHECCEGCMEDCHGCRGRDRRPSGRIGGRGNLQGVYYVLMPEFISAG